YARHERGNVVGLGVADVGSQQQCVGGRLHLGPQIVNAVATVPLHGTIQAHVRGSQGPAEQGQRERGGGLGSAQVRRGAEPRGCLGSHLEVRRGGEGLANANHPQGQQEGKRLAPRLDGRQVGVWTVGGIVGAEQRVTPLAAGKPLPNERDDERKAL